MLLADSSSFFLMEVWNMKKAEAHGTWNLGINVGQNRCIVFVAGKRGVEVGFSPFLNPTHFIIS